MPLNQVDYFGVVESLLDLSVSEVGLGLHKFEDLLCDGGDEAVKHLAAGDIGCRDVHRLWFLFE